MAAEISSAFPAWEVETVPGGKGDFIVTADGRKLWDKRRMDDEFPEHPKLLDELKKLAS